MEWLKKCRLGARVMLSNFMLMSSRVPAEKVKEMTIRDLAYKFGQHIMDKAEITERPEDDGLDTTTIEATVYALSPSEFKTLVQNYNDMKAFIGGMSISGNSLAEMVINQVVARERALENAVANC